MALAGAQWWLQAPMDEWGRGGMVGDVTGDGARDFVHLNYLDGYAAYFPGGAAPATPFLVPEDATLRAVNDGLSSGFFSDIDVGDVDGDGFNDLGRAS